MAISKSVAAVGMVVIAVVAFAVGLFASPLVFPPVTGDPIWDGIVERGKIRVGSSPDWPPYEYLNETTGKFIGFEVELLETIADELDLTVEWTEMTFEFIVPEIKKGAAATIDLGVSGFSVREDRLGEVQFTMHHSITTGEIIMLKSRRDALAITQIDSLEDLVDLGLTCGAQEGTTQHQELSEKAPGSLRPYPDYIAALTELKRTPPAIDCIYAETPITTEWIALAEEAGEEPLVVIYTRPYYPVAFVANKDADTLVEKINGVLTEMIGSGDLDALKKVWRC